MPHINILWSCTHWQSVWRPETVAGLCFKNLNGKKYWLVLMSADMWPAGSELDPAACKRHDSAYASVCTASEQVSFFQVAKVTLGLGEKHPTYCLHSWETRKREKLTARVNADQPKYTTVWFGHIKCVYHSGMWCCLLPVQPCDGFYCPPSSSIKHVLVNWQSF